jgi:uncharacterized membrane protein YfcA
MFGVFTAARHYRHSGLVRFREEKFGFIMTFIGAGIGAVVVQQVDPKILGYIIPVFLLFIALYTIFTPSLGKIQTQSKISKETFFLIFGSVLGFYDGFLVPVSVHSGQWHSCRYWDMRYEKRPLIPK